VRAQAHLAVGAEGGARPLEQHSLQVAQGDVLVDGQALDLVEHRRVRRVVVAPVGLAGEDVVQRRLLQLHLADLHRRGVRAQQHVLGDVEGVLQHPRRVVGQVVERVEVVVVPFGLGPVLDVEADAHEEILDVAPRLRQQVEGAARRGRVARQRHIDAVLRQTGRQLRPGQRARLRLEQRLDGLADLVGLLAHRPALIGRQLADRAQSLGQLRLAAEVAHAQVLGLGRGERSGDRGFGLVAQRVEITHGGPS